MVRFSLSIKTCCLHVVWGKQDQVWAKIFCITKNMHSRTLMLRAHPVRGESHIQSNANREVATSHCQVIQPFRL